MPLAAMKNMLHLTWEEFSVLWGRSINHPPPPPKLALDIKFSGGRCPSLFGCAIARAQKYGRPSADLGHRLGFDGLLHRLPRALTIRGGFSRYSRSRQQSRQSKVGAYG